jgi:ADP-ribose pyrophosphatase YjhB (NUDIX family)
VSGQRSIARPELAVGAIVVHDRQLLVVRRGRGPALGKWSVPGGRVERGEPVREAVAREVAEETGLAVDVGNLAVWVERIGDAPDDFHFVILDFFATVRGDATPVAGDDALEARWIPLEGVRDLDLVDQLLDVLVALGTVPA